MRIEEKSPPPNPIVFGCIWLGPAKYNQIQRPRRWLHARQPKEQARVWHCIAPFHHTLAYSIYWEDYFASRVWTQALKRVNLNSACQYGFKRGSFDAN